MLRKWVWGASLGLLVLAFGASFLLSAVPEEKEALPVLKTKPRILTVFKNGLGFFMRDGETALRDGWAVTEHVPSAALGTFWVTSLEEGAPVEETVSFLAEAEKEVPAGSLDVLLNINIGKKVVVTANNQILEGTIKAAPGNLLILTTKDDAEVALNKGSVIKIQFSGPHGETLIQKEAVKRMKFKVAGRSAKARLRLAYLQKGVTWSPSYLVNIEDPAKARLTMKATLVDDVEDLEEVDVYFVVGYPNFRFADVLSPMALDQALAQFLQELERGEKKAEAEFSQLGNVLRQKMAFAEADVSLDYGLAGLPGLPGAPEEDLFLYAKKGVRLKKGERAEYPIFSSQVDYKHVYEWSVPDTLNVDPNGYQQSREQRETIEQVWHSVKLTNSTDFPWTTAPAMTVNGWKPLAQDILDYTPRGTSSNLKLTVATDIKTDKRENEAERQRDVRLYGYDYDLVTIKGELSAKNAKTKDVTMEIKKRVTGEVLEASHGGTIRKVAEGLRGANSNSLISWEIPVRAGEEVKIAYTYKVYIRH